MNLFKKVLKKSFISFEYKINDLLFRTGLKAVKPRLGCTILVYHGVKKSKLPFINDRFVSYDRLHEDFLHLKNYYNIISLKDYLYGEYDKLKSNVVISFDDGYLNNYKYVLPLSKSLNIPIAFCITALPSVGGKILWTDYLDLFIHIYKKPISIQGQTFFPTSKFIFRRQKFENIKGIDLKQFAMNEDAKFIDVMLHKMQNVLPLKELEKYKELWELMAYEDIKSLKEENLITVVSHGLYHHNHLTIKNDESLFAMQESKKYLENILNCEIGIWSYPFGKVSSETICNAKKSGYLFQLTSEGNEAMGKQVFPRFTTHPYISSFNQMEAIYNEKYR